MTRRLIDSDEHKALLRKVQRADVLEQSLRIAEDYFLRYTEMFPETEFIEACGFVECMTCEAQATCKKRDAQHTKPRHTEWCFLQPLNGFRPE